MGKGRKRKNPGIGIDFRKAKHKVGKTLKKAANVTDTTIKSQSIHVPSQSLAADKQDKAVTTRNLTLKDLVTQLGHYSAKVRRDALMGMAELFSSHPEELTKHAAIVIEAVGGKTSDVDAAVRATVLKLLSEQILPKLAGQVLQPFMPLLMAHICSTMTHLALEVRGDALKFLNELMKYEHNIIGTNFLVDCLNHFADMCGSLNHSRTLELSSHATMYKVVKAIRSFLAKVCESHQSSKAEGNDGSAAGKDVLFSNLCDWFPVEGYCSQGAQKQSKHIGSRDASSAYNSLFGRLLSFLSMGCASQPEGSSLESPMAMQFTTAVLDSLYHLLILSNAQQSAGIQAKATTSLKMMQKARKVVVAEICPFFPMEMPTLASDPTIITLVSDFNVAASQLFLQLVLSEKSPKEQSSALLSPLTKFYSGLIDKGTHPQAASSLISLLPDICHALPLLESGTRLSILREVGRLVMSCQETPDRLPFLNFLLDIMKGLFRLQNPVLPEVEDSLVIAWLKMLPKVMWEAGNRNIEATKVCLSIIHHAARTGRPSIMKQLNEMQKELMLMFVIVKESNNKVTARPGPLHRFPLEVQYLAVDVMYYVPLLSDIVIRTCLTVCLMDSFPLDTSRRFLSIVNGAMENNRVSQRAVALLMQGLITGESGWDLGHHKSNLQNWKKPIVLCSAACDLMWTGCTASTGHQEIEDVLTSMFLNHREEGTSIRQSRLLFGVVSLAAYIVCIGPKSLGSLFNKVLPEIVALYWMAVVEDEKGLFSLENSPGDSPAVCLVAKYEGLVGGIVDWMQKRIGSLELDFKEGMSIEKVEACEKTARVLLSLVRSSEESAVVSQKEQLSTAFASLSSLLEGCRTGTEVEHKFRTSLGKCIAHCEHIWGKLIV